MLKNRIKCKKSGEKTQIVKFTLPTKRWNLINKKIIPNGALTSMLVLLHKVCLEYTYGYN